MQYDHVTAPDQGAEEISEHGIPRRLGGWSLHILTALALAFSTFQLVVAAFSPLSSQVTRSLHVGFLLLIAFVLYPSFRHGAKLSRVPWHDWLLAILAFVLSLYHWVFEAELIQRSGDPSNADLVVGAIFVVLVFEATRRLMGLALPIMCAVFLAYGLWGQYLPEFIAHRGYGFDQIIGTLFLSTEGIFGVPTWVSATYIFLFILFGAFLEHAGMIRLFNALALGLVGHTQGGPAKVAVISSGLMGTISGSGVANVLTVGQFTIPLMTRYGYTPVFAGAVEATASMGGQIMPPVMGAVAFIMAETLNVPYSDIVKAAIIPAVLYYFTAFWMVHLEAGSKGLFSIPKSELPNPWRALKADWHLALPLAALVGMLFHGFTPMFAGMIGLALTTILILGAAIAAHISSTAFRYVFWLAVGLGASTFAQWGIVPVLAVIVALVAISFSVRGSRHVLHTLKMSLVDGAKQALPVGLACAIVGIIVGVLSLTGAASTLATWIMAAGEKNLFLSLLLTMVICIVLGTGIPTIPNYIITAAIAAPALAKLGVPLIISHMFAFYFGIMADLTPPVALAALAASSIAKANHDAIGWKATQIAIVGFVVPYMAVYEPALMLQGDFTLLGVVAAVSKAVLAIMLWAVAMVGYWRLKLAIWERIATVLAAGLLVAYLPGTNEAGLLLATVLAAQHWWRSRRAASADFS
ncbi:TRAP transporter permease [Sulfurisoma sediminicola]|uniref:TRAP transporter 4TM/12TM fusion protein n=1 Tax=Sulfurisoma sediminicola TaxID=1381557 RepID=A0A497XN97_9PROT|nr:TRAP transporter permease [Sulfurisoma sediminicola]RLJ67868.1 TRAP transporter 4TM/12TM fusion protein [Sulfurisoma sediminicola]